MSEGPKVDDVSPQDAIGQHERGAVLLDVREDDERAAGHVLVEFTFPEEPPTNRRYWLLAERGSAELCYSHPGGETDVFITACSEAFTRWHLGVLDWRRAVADGSITVAGSPEFSRLIPTWNRHPEPVSVAT